MGKLSVDTSDVSMERFLDHLIDPLECIDTYGKSYLDDLEFISRENHGYDPVTKKFPTPRVQEYFEQICKRYQVESIQEVMDYARRNQGQISFASYRPRTSFHDLVLFGSERPDAYQQLIKGEASDAVAANNEFQKVWSSRGIVNIPKLNNDADLYELYLSYDRFSPWTYLLRREIARGNIDRGDKAICIGPRWVGEILYFRQNVGLPNTKGVDLLPSQPEFIVAADMHSLPFEDDSIKLVFCRATIDKSYDCRLFVSEIKRVLRPDGFVILETIGPHPQGVNPVGRTDVKSSANLLRLFAGVARRVIYQQDRPPTKSQGKVNHIIQIMVQLDKSGATEVPVVEPFPEIKYAIFWKCRYVLLRLRLKLKQVLGRIGS